MQAVGTSAERDNARQSAAGQHGCTEVRRYPPSSNESTPSSGDVDEAHAFTDEAGCR